MPASPLGAALSAALARDAELHGRPLPTLASAAGVLGLTSPQQASANQQAGGSRARATPMGDATARRTTGVEAPSQPPTTGTPKLQQVQDGGGEAHTPMDDLLVLPPPVDSYIKIMNGDLAGERAQVLQGACAREDAFDLG